MIDSLLAIIAPHACLGCNCEGALLCARCCQELPTIVPRCYRCERSTVDARTCTQCVAGQALYAIRARTVYDGTAKALIAKLKFERARAAARDIAWALPAPPIWDGHERLVVHAPTATGRIRERGYDQAQLIARQYAKIHAVACAPALVRMGQQRQLGGTGAQRRRQLEGAFRVTRPTAVAGKHIILVDDVVTTGATLAAAAAALKASGAWRVEAVALARA